MFASVQLWLTLRFANDRHNGKERFHKIVYIDRPLHLQLHAALARALINLSVLLCAMASYETGYGGSIAVKRSINGFDISWVGKDRIEVRRDRFPKLFSTHISWNL